MFFSGMDITQIIFRTISFLVAIVLHEVAHWYVSFRLGDPTAKMMGRLTLNPLKHLDPVGTIMLLLVWLWRAKPVPINPTYYKNPAKWELLVALAWPITNLILAVIAIFLIVFILFLVDWSQNWLFIWEWWLIINFLMIFARINIILAIFNLLPIPPLDWFNILKQFNPSIASKINRFQIQYSRVFFLILIVLLKLGLFNFISDIAQFILQGIYMIFASIFL